MTGSTMANTLKVMGELAGLLSATFTAALVMYLLDATTPWYLGLGAVVFFLAFGMCESNRQEVLKAYALGNLSTTKEK